jgi:hypothetical protein
MARIHLFEIEDQPWLPDSIRDAVTGFLFVSHKVGKLNRLFIPKIIEAIDTSKNSQIIDLGSGAGGPMPSIQSDLKVGGRDVRLTLTDLYPNADAIKEFNGNDAINYLSQPVDATNVNSDLSGLRTMIGSFHHLRENTAKSVLKDAQESNQPIAIFEGFGRNVQSFILLLPSIIMAFLLMPFVRPFRWQNLFFTYLVPVLPLIVFFDGWVSFLRVYSPSELRDIVSQLPENEHYIWEIGTLGPQSAPYIVGLPRKLDVT